jgi:hypothetical protein
MSQTRIEMHATSSHCSSDSSVSTHPEKQHTQQLNTDQTSMMLHFYSLAARHASQAVHWFQPAAPALLLLLLLLLVIAVSSSTPGLSSSPGGLPASQLPPLFVCCNV